MKTLQFLPVMAASDSDGEELRSSQAQLKPVSLGEGATRGAPAGHTSFGLWYQGRLVARPLPQGADTIPKASLRKGQLIALLHAQCESGDRVWFLVPNSDELGINGLSPPLPLVRLEPGTLLSLGQRFWMATMLWSPEPVPAPSDLAEKPCPVCGGPLNLAPVVQCVCGRWTHLERPDQLHDEDSLNCYLTSGTCGSCGRPAALQPQLVPEPSERLLPPSLEPDTP